MVEFIQLIIVALGLLFIGILIWAGIRGLCTPIYRGKLDDYARQKGFQIKNRTLPFAILYKTDEVGIEIASRKGIFGTDLTIKSFKEVFITKMQHISIRYFIADDRAKAFHIIRLINDKGSDASNVGDSSSKPYLMIPYEKVLRVEISEKGKIIYEKDNAVGRALVGGALFGSAGAIVGSTSATTTATTEETATLRILVDNIENPSLVINGLDVNNTENVKDIIDVVLNRIQKEGNQSNLHLPQKDSTVRTVSSTSVADELMKLAKLKETGILSEEEFNFQKSKLLNS